MGIISISQQRVNANNEQSIQQELLQMSLIPLAETLKNADTWKILESDIVNFHGLFINKGQTSHHLFLQDASGEIVVSARGKSQVSSSLPTHTKHKDHFRADIPIISPLLEGGKGLLIVHNDPVGYSNMLKQRWWLWFTHFAVTVGIVSFFLVLIIYYQVTRPVNQLVRAVKKMEQGYWGALEEGSGAWEIRWLSWRFSSMAKELKNTMKHLFEAEQKTRTIVSKRANIEPVISAVPELNNHCDSRGDSRKVDPSQLPEYQELLLVCEELEAASATDDYAVQLAQKVSRQQIPLANRLGFHQLKARMENEALRLTKPETFNQLDKHLDTYKTKWHSWLGKQRKAMQHNLEKQGISCTKLLHRTKHTAGVWNKMKSKDLDMDEVYDLFAFRIIVPTEADCYVALGLIHDAYSPEVSRFKDYITQPKANGYQSIHTCVKSKNGPVFEVQIRSIAMDLQAERGDAAHWLYKEDSRPARHQKTSWWHSLFSKFKSKPNEHYN